jgi:hypothetical protein
MTVKVSVDIAASLEGFIARKNGDLDWLPAGKEGGEDFGHTEFILKSVDLRRMALRQKSDRAHQQGFDHPAWTCRQSGSASFISPRVDP